MLFLEALRRLASSLLRHRVPLLAERIVKIVRQPKTFEDLK